MNDACSICGATRGLDRHHIMHRQIGGSKDPAEHDAANLITLCRRCHTNLHEASWELERLPEGFGVRDRSTGRPVMRRLHRADVDAPVVFHQLALAEASLIDLLQTVPYLTDEQLVEAFMSAVTFGKRAWLLQAAVLYEAQQRSIYGDRSLEALARRFDISLRQAEKYALVWHVFFARRGETPDGSSEGGELKNVNIDEIVLDEPSWYVVAASETPDPATWLAYAQDRKLEDPRYSVAAFRRDIRAARFLGNREQQSEGAGLGVEYSAARLACPWIRAYCTKSGRPVPVAQCSECECGGEAGLGGTAMEGTDRE